MVRRTGPMPHSHHLGVRMQEAALPRWHGRQGVHPSFLLRLPLFLLFGFVVGCPLRPLSTPANFPQRLCLLSECACGAAFRSVILRQRGCGGSIIPCAACL